MRLPEPLVPALRGGPLLRWGVVAPGRIAEAWVRSVLTYTDQRVVSVASRSRARADEFAARHRIATAHDRYDGVFGDSGVDIVYIAAPHSEHRALALRAISAGKHVLIEKPIAVTAAEAEDIAAAARSAGVFALEAMWSRFLPQASVISQLLDHTLGEVRYVTADFGGVAPFDPVGRAFNPALGGGVLLDMGVYPVAFAHHALGAPTRVTASGSLATTGVDDQAALVLDYASGAQSVLTSSMLVETPRTAAISCTEGRIELAGPFFGPTSLRVTAREGVGEWADATGFVMGDGLCYQAVAAAGHVAAGRTEAPEHTLDDAIAVMRVLDEARAQIGAG